MKFEVIEVKKRKEKMTIKSTYDKVKNAQGGVSYVPIATLRDALGLSQEEIETMARACPDVYQLAIGDYSLASDHERSGAITILGKAHLLIRVNL